jgi:Holliday junction DNA helicase RuvA
LIGYIEGELKEQREDTVIVLTAGVGYEVHCSVNTLDEIFGQKMVSLQIHTHVREDILQLFGFSTVAEKEIFLALNQVNGIGPKMALKILSGTRVEDLVKWIQDGDITALTGLPKVGKKTAEQIIITLKDKITQKIHLKPTVKMVPGKKDIVSALVNLGYNLAEVEKVVGLMPVGIDFSEGIRESLKHLSGHN